MNVLPLFEALLKNTICFLFQTDQPGVKNTAPRGTAFMSNLINCCFSEVFAHTNDPCLNVLHNSGFAGRYAMFGGQARSQMKQLLSMSGKAGLLNSSQCSDQSCPQCCLLAWCKQEAVALQNTTDKKDLRRPLEEESMEGEIHRTRPRQDWILWTHVPQLTSQSLSALTIHETAHWVTWVPCACMYG